MNNLTSRIGLLLLAGLMSANAAAADLKVGVITSLSGPTSALGIPYEKGIRAAHTQWATIVGNKVEVIVLDDASDPTTAARNARKLIAEDRVDVIIGTSGVPGTMAIASLARELKVPLIAPSPISLPGAENAWTVTVSQPFELMVAAAVKRMATSNVKTVAFIGFSDALGDLAYESLTKSAATAGIRVVSNERYARTDPSVAGQVLKLLAKRPDAVFAGNSGTPGALPYVALAERGYRGQIYGTHGLLNPDFVRIGGAAIEGLLVPSGSVLVAEQLSADDPIRKVSLDFRRAYQKVHGVPPADAFSAYTYDAFLVLADAATRAKGEPGTPAFRASLRDAVLSTRGLPGTHGIYTFTSEGRYGSDERGIVVVRLTNGQWQLAR